MNFSVEEENLICMYHTSDRRRTIARMLTALPDMDTEMRHQHQQRSKQCCPKGLPTSTAHGIHRLSFA